MPKLDVTPPPGADDGSDAALERLLERYSSVLREQIAKHCPRNLGIQFSEIEQEVRTRLWKALRRETDLTDPTSYIYRVAATSTIDAVRRVLARREEQLDTEVRDGEPAFDLVTDPVQAPDAVMERREMMSAIAAALGSLGENRRIAVELHLQGLTVMEIARLQHWTEPKARNLVYRGLDDLRAALRREGIDYP
jgi:RNA polymerase sigma-70 factor, ECF subfamily